MDTRYCRRLLYGYKGLRGRGVILPIGSFEDHFDEPMVLDTLLALEVSCRLAEECGWLVAWPLGYGFSPEHRYSVSLDEDLDALLVARVVEGLLGLGVSRVVVVDGHYGHRAALAAVAEARGIGYINVWDLLSLEGYRGFEEQLVFEKIFSEYIRGGGGEAGPILDRLARGAAARLGCSHGLDEA